MPSQSGGLSVASASVTEPLLDIHDGLTTPTEASYTGWRHWHRHGGTVMWVAGIAALGTASGLGVPDIYTPLPPWAATISSIIGWSYFWCWSLSFYPQIAANWSRHSVVGLSFDFVLYNAIGFVCYASYTCGLFLSSSVRAEYAARHGGHVPSVRLNDVVFSVHACVCGAVFLAQIAAYERGGQAFSRTCKWAVAVLLAGIGAALLSAFLPAAPLQPLDFLYLLSYIKVVITLVKYTPQAMLSYRRQSTRGYEVAPVLCDFAGGILSVTQQVFDACVLQDPAVVTGNLSKIMVGLVGMAFNVIMLFQHFVLYTERGADDKPAGLGAVPCVHADEDGDKCAC